MRLRSKMELKTKYNVGDSIFVLNPYDFFPTVKIISVQILDITFSQNELCFKYRRLPKGFVIYNAREQDIFRTKREAVEYYVEQLLLNLVDDKVKH